LSRVLVAGCGYVGTALGVELAGGGDRVFGLRRDPSRLPREIARVAADLADPATLRDLPEVDAVVYAAAANGFSPAAYRAAYVDGLANLLAALPQPPRRLIFVSSTSVYGQQQGEWVDEDSPAEADHWSADALREGERRANDGAATATVLRLGGIYGPGRTRLIDEALAGATYAAGEPRYTNRIHRDDAARMIAFLVNRALAGAALDKVYNGVDNEPSLNVDVLAYIGDLLQGRTPGETDITAKAPPPNVAVGGKRVGNARIRALGFQFGYSDFRSGYAAVVKDYRR